VPGVALETQQTTARDKPNIRMFRDLPSRHSAAPGV